MVSTDKPAGGVVGNVEPLVVIDRYAVGHFPAGQQVGMVGADGGEAAKGRIHVNPARVFFSDAGQGQQIIKIDSIDCSAAGDEDKGRAVQ